jgi:hypothetical protein
METVKAVYSITTEQLAERWNYNARTLREHVAAGTFPIAPLLPNVKSLRFALVAVERYEAQTLAA